MSRRRVIKKMPPVRAPPPATAPPDTLPPLLPRKPQQSHRPQNFPVPNEVYTPDEVLFKGLIFVQKIEARQRKVKRQTNVKRFRSCYGADPAVYAQLWCDLQTTDIAEARIDTKVCTFEGFLLALNFLKRYPTETAQSNVFGPSENTIRKWRWYFVDRISALVATKIQWPTNWATICIISVDGVHFRINEPTHGKYSKNTKYYSHKFKTSALNYEIAIDLATSRVVHYNGPFPASKNDITIFREQLKDKIPDGCLAIGDKGYLGEPDKLMTPNSHDVKKVRKFKGRARARHESFNKMLKRFECLDQRFIHGEENHLTVFEGVLVICQYQMEMGEPLFDV